MGAELMSFWKQRPGSRRGKLQTDCTVWLDDRIRSEEYTRHNRIRESPQLIYGNQSLTGFNFSPLRPQQIAQCVPDLLDLISHQKIKLFANTSFPLANVRTAFEALSSRRTIGKVVLTPYQEKYYWDIIPGRPAMTAYHRTKIDGSKIFYREAGPKTASAILLLHGFPNSKLSLFIG
jgi:hypothetical protein